MATEDGIPVSVTVDSAEEEQVPSSSEPESTSTAGSSTEETSSPPSVDREEQRVDMGVAVDEMDGNVKEVDTQEKDKHDDQKDTDEDEEDSEKENKPVEPAEPAVLLPPRPDNPQQWTWRCHKCHTHYALAVTNRCLSDGHYFCYGLAQGSKHWGRRQRQVRGESSLGASCTSSFDYSGWEAMAAWQRRVRQQRGSSPSPGCWQGCKYPGECRQSTLDGILDSPAGEADTIPPNPRFLPPDEIPYKAPSPALATKPSLKRNKRAATTEPASGQLRKKAKKTKKGTVTPA
ncbi:hypothetical protein MGYG_08786 [Nannizzia gypsea CBS 118893]|uniref:Uncharacterized protein n=1 Tax=Arthroderma gypseum (strain ATCC MYA-4604 / CBS 118893) TaxID=535722 RepID=E4V700_ARTGP|nr:hypothetical protein MGYG_08786 [Nannizzia gypsea CBS 118893]EFQ96866.1 hypothetical protein MGYG_08786 [Nannizzia gypsea CBS 118893]